MKEIWEETLRTCVEKLHWPEKLASSRMEAAIKAFPESMVKDYESFVDQCEKEDSSQVGHGFLEATPKWGCCIS
jgi:hypothetical protein